mmetsp:Transcript_31200/g.35030  ORF Transcript_31200/g.35030 Transcript_31200/m.35030 type:complete len:109 (-) Transcript_31200:42-368(-)
MIWYTVYYSIQYMLLPTGSVNVHTSPPLMFCHPIIVSSLSNNGNATQCHVMSRDQRERERGQWLVCLFRYIRYDVSLWEVYHHIIIARVDYVGDDFRKPISNPAEISS